MILDCVENFFCYQAMHPGFQAAAEYLSKTDLQQLPTGRHEIDGDRFYVNVMEVEAHCCADAQLEYHRKYIDLQLVLSGDETMGWTALKDMPAETPFDQENDYALLKGTVTAWFPVKPGCFALFFPQDAHAPCCGQGKIRKAVLKILY